MTYTEGVSFRPFLMYKRIDSFPTVQYFLIKCSIRTPFRRTKLNLPPPHDFSLYENTGGGGGLKWIPVSTVVAFPPILCLACHIQSVLSTLGI
jgi:hypothetical protein